MKRKSFHHLPTQHPSQQKKSRRLYACGTIIRFIYEKKELYDSLSLHSICNLKEACDVGTSNIVTLKTVLLGSIVKIVEDVDHDVLELSINLFEGPAESLGVLAHLKS